MKSINYKPWVLCKPVPSWDILQEAVLLSALSFNFLWVTACQCLERVRSMVTDCIYAQWPPDPGPAGAEPPPPRPGSFLELGFRLSHVLSISFYILPLLYSRGPRWCCTLCLRVCDSTNLIAFRCFKRFIVKTFYKGQIPEPQLLFFLCSYILRTPSALFRFSINPLLGLVIWSLCLWPKWEHTRRL